MLLLATIGIPKGHGSLSPIIAWQQNQNFGITRTTRQKSNQATRQARLNHIVTDCTTSTNNVHGPNVLG